MSPGTRRIPLEVELEPDLQHARRDDLLHATEVRRRELRREIVGDERIERRLRRETLRRGAGAVLRRARIEHVVELGDERYAMTAKAEPLVGPQRQQVERVISIGSAGVDRRGLRSLHVLDG